MLQVRRHTSHDYASLPDIDRSNVAHLTARDHACLDEVGRYLVGAGAHTRFGVSLLHSHFPVSDGEVLVESADRSSRTVSLRPVPVDAEGGDDLVALNVCFDSGDSGDRLGLVGLEYGRRRSSAATAGVSELDSVTLHGLREILGAHDAIRRFGVRLLHDPLHLAEGEVLLESCDLTERTLECEVTTVDDERFVRSVQTFWCWEPVEGDDLRSTIQSCKRNCLAGCISGAGPDGGHHKGPHDTLHDRG